MIVEENRITQAKVDEYLSANPEPRPGSRGQLQFLAFAITDEGTVTTGPILVAAEAARNPEFGVSDWLTERAEDALARFGVDTDRHPVIVWEFGWLRAPASSLS